MKCPHCSKELIIEVRGPAPQTYLPAGDLDDALAEYHKYIEVTPGEGVLFVRLEGYVEDKIWTAVNKIVKAHGGKYIKGGDKPGHWEVPT